MAEAFRISREGGASGISLFNYHSLTEEHWKALKAIHEG